MGAVIADSPRALFERNRLVANGLDTDREGLGLFGSPHSRIAGNTISDNGDISVFASDAEDVVFEWNAVSGHPEVGMLIEGSTGNVFGDNRLARNAVGIAFSGDGNVITRNRVFDSRAGLDGGGLGISVEGGHDNVVERNVVVRATKAGILVSAPPRNWRADRPR